MSTISPQDQMSVYDVAALTLGELANIINDVRVEFEQVQAAAAEAEARLASQQVELTDWILVADGIKHDWRCCHGEADTTLCLRCQLEQAEARLASQGEQIAQLLTPEAEKQLRSRAAFFESSDVDQLIVKRLDYLAEELKRQQERYADLQARTVTAENLVVERADQLAAALTARDEAEQRIASLEKMGEAGILPAPVGRQTPTDPPQTSRSELMRHAVQRGGRPMDVAALPAPVGGQTPLQSPVLAFQEWATRRAEQFGPLSQDQYLLAQEAFFAAHPGEGPSSQFIEKVGGQTPTEPPPDWQRKFERSQQRWGNLKARVNGEIATFESPNFTPQQRSQYANGVARLRWVLDEMAKSPDVLQEAIPVAPPPTAFTREQLEADAVWCENRAGTYAPRRAADGRNNEALVALERRDVYGRLADICRFVAQTLPAEGRQETR